MFAGSVPRNAVAPEAARDFRTMRSRRCARGLQLQRCCATRCPRPIRPARQQYPVSRSGLSSACLHGLSCRRKVTVPTLIPLQPDAVTDLRARVRRSNRPPRAAARRGAIVHVSSRRHFDEDGAGCRTRSGAKGDLLPRHHCHRRLHRPLPADRYGRPSGETAVSPSFTTIFGFSGTRVGTHAIQDR